MSVSGGLKQSLDSDAWTINEVVDVGCKSVVVGVHRGGFVVLSIEVNFCSVVLPEVSWVIQGFFVGVSYVIGEIEVGVVPQSGDFNGVVASGWVRESYRVS